MSLFQPAKPTLLDPNANTSGLDKMMESIQGLFNAKLQMEDQQYREQQRALGQKEYEQQLQQFNFAYEGLANTYGEDKIKQFHDMGMAPNVAKQYLEKEKFDEFISQHPDGYTVADVQQQYEYLSGDAIKMLMSSASDSYERLKLGAEVQANNWLYEAKPSNYSEFTEYAHSIGLEPTKYKAMWDEYTQHKKDSEKALSVDPKNNNDDVAQTAAIASAKQLQDIFQSQGLDITKIPVTKENSVHMTRSLSTINTLKQNLTAAQAELPPNAYRGFDIRHAKDGETIIMKNKDITINVTEKGSVRVFIDGKFVKNKDIPKKYEHVVNAISAAGYDKIERLSRAKNNYVVGVKEEYKRLTDNYAVVDQINNAYGGK